MERLNSEKDFFDNSSINYEKIKESEYIQKDPLLLELVETPYFRNLEEKTQVTQRFISEKDVSTRLTHTHQVMEISSLVAEIRGADVQRAVRIATFHDTGHTPFGHVGERVIQEIINNITERPTIIGDMMGKEQIEEAKKIKPFKHAMMSSVVFDHVFKNMKATSISQDEYEILKEGILKHGGKFFRSQSEEGKIVSLADKLAFLTQDLEDANKIGFNLNYPRELGNNPKEILENVINNVKLNSKNENILDNDVLDKINNLKSFMYENFYASKDLEEIDRMLANILNWSFFNWYSDLLDLREDIEDGVPEEYIKEYYKVFNVDNLEDLKSLFNFENSLLQFCTLSDEDIFEKEPPFTKEWMKKSLQNYKKFGIIEDYSV